MSALVTIMAHGEPHAVQTFYRHLPFWRAHGFPLLVMCPEDSQVPAAPNLPVLAIGKRSHHDAEANLRFRTLLMLLAQTQYDRHIIYEYDSLCLSPELPSIERGVWGNVFKEENPKPPFQSPFYIHPPLIVDDRTLTRLVEHQGYVTDDAEGGFWDRWLGALCLAARVKPKTLGDHGYSKNTIESRHLAEACAMAAEGTSLFHGVKDAITLQYLQKAYATFARIKFDAQHSEQLEPA